MNLNRFERLDNPLPVRQVTAIIKEIASDDFDIQWNRTTVRLADHFWRKVWQEITRNCIR